jgi:hypothetical protein
LTDFAASGAMVKLPPPLTASWYAMTARSADPTRHTPDRLNGAASGTKKMPVSCTPTRRHRVLVGVVARCRHVVPEGQEVEGTSLGAIHVGGDELTFT